MKILVTGANGQLGMSLRVILSEAKDLSVVFTDVVDAPGVQTTHLDITDAAAVRAMVAAEKVDAIINCAAYTNVDAAEDNPELAELLNAAAVGILAEAMKEVGGLLVHISTDYVFGKEPYNRPCREDQQGTPTGVYGLTKLRGEQAILASGVRHIIIRTSWLYSEYGKNFVKTMLKLTAERPQLNVVFDQVGTPTYAGDLAAAIVEILNAVTLLPETGLAHVRKGQNRSPRLQSQLCGIYNFSNEGVCSWYDFAKTIQRIASEVRSERLPVSDSERPAIPLEGVQGVEKEDVAGICDIRPCHSDEFPSKVHRPSYSVLDKTKIKNTFGLTIPYWTESLKICIQNLNA